jgi:DNA repair exonuclease SbcCD ATPase subunit
MKSILSLFRPSKTEVAIQEDLTRGREKPKPSTVTYPTRSTTPTPATVGGTEVETLRASLADLDARLQAVTSERDQLKAEFSSYRQSANEDVSDLERINRDLKTQLAQTGRMLSEQIASTGQPGPIPGIHKTGDSAHQRTEAHFLKIARQIKGATGGNPSRIERP